ncbi:MAG: transglutaminase domain-containing protein [Acidobacteriota bacterium]
MIKRLLIKRFFLVCLGLGILLAFSCWLIISCPAHCRFTLNRLIMQVESKVYALQGKAARLVSLQGLVVTKQLNKRVLIGAEVEALDSVSGWATLTDQEGKFILPQINWHPGARYTLAITANDYQVRQLDVDLPIDYPNSGIIDLGELEFDRGCTINPLDLPGRNSISHIEYDDANSAFYKNLFLELTSQVNSDEEKILQLTKYVASRLTTDIGAENYRTPRPILEMGSRHCGKLTLALATLAEAGNYQTRIIDLIDSISQPNAHMVTEIYYGDRWHLYDPCGSKTFHKLADRVASYKELRLNTELVSTNTILQHSPIIPTHQENWLATLYRSGFHHYYYFKNRANTPLD